MVKMSPALIERIKAEARKEVATKAGLALKAKHQGTDFFARLSKMGVDAKRAKRAKNTSQEDR